MGIIIFALVVFMIFSSIFYYLTVKLAPVFQLDNKVIIFLIPICYTFLFLTVRFYIEMELLGSIGNAISRANYYIIGLALILLPMFLLLDITRGILRIASAVVNHPVITAMLHIVNHKSTIIACLTLGLSLSLLGTYNFYRAIEVEYITIKSDKVTTPQTFIHITDLQLGSVSPQHVKKVRDKILQTVQQLRMEGKTVIGILNTGDHIDSANYQMADLLPLGVEQTANLPQYFSLGNHEFYHKTERILNQLGQLGIQVLRDKNSQLGQLNVIGIDDEKIHTLVQKQHLIDKSKFNVLLYHRPDLPLNLKQMGIDLVLSGHTHGGQIYPYSWGLKLLYNAPQGLSTLASTHVYVSDGIGLWGPIMRLGTTNQFAVITIEPEL